VSPEQALVERTVSKWQVIRCEEYDEELVPETSGKARLQNPVLTNRNCILRRVFVLDKVAQPVPVPCGITPKSVFTKQQTT